MPDRSVLPALVALSPILASLLWSQSPGYQLGHAPSEREIRAWDIEVGPDGQGLPPGRGTAVEGKRVYARQCAECHGDQGQGGDQGGPLVGGQGTLNSKKPVRTVGSFWPYATTLWDYVNRAMPFFRPGILSHDQVYAVVAYLLYLNGLIAEDEVMDAGSLPRVEMPNRDGFVPDARPDIAIDP